MLGKLASIVTIPVGTTLRGFLPYLFRLNVIQWLVSAVVVGIVAAAGYFFSKSLLPPWFNLQTLRDSIGDMAPPIAYFLHLVSFYEGAPLVLTAYVVAWVAKKLPSWTWLGPLFRLAKGPAA